MKHPLIFILYDSINNSVFAGQVLQPLIARRQQHPEQPIHLVSFETSKYALSPMLQQQLNTHNIQLHIFKKFPLIHKLSLWPAIWQLKKFLQRFHSYALIVRGPLAGYIALHTLDKNKCQTIMVQARGLLAEEYTYAHKLNKNSLTNMWHRYKVNLLHYIEQYVYAPHIVDMLTIQAVSPALKSYIIQTYKTPDERITIAQHDLPPTITPAQKATWRHDVRKQLHIAPGTHVYCYNGSAKPWQCPELVLDFFKAKYTQSKKSFLLILTQDITQFTQLAQRYELDNGSYTICSVPHKQIYTYLSACDTGLLFREEHIINWVSRPTKIIEYQAVGLAIVHNNTVEYLAKK